MSNIFVSYRSADAPGEKHNTCQDGHNTCQEVAKKKASPRRRMQDPLLDYFVGMKPFLIRDGEKTAETEPCRIGGKRIFMHEFTSCLDIPEKRG